ncbi:hypothetical protein MMC13_005755 [Lambiella insularis]|nr:hypothetical protein [Lambiella insularis]
MPPATNLDPPDIILEVAGLGEARVVVSVAVDVLLEGVPGIDMLGTKLDAAGVAEVVKYGIEAFDGIAVNVLVVLRVDVIMDAVEAVSKQ